MSIEELSLVLSIGIPLVVAAVSWGVASNKISNNDKAIAAMKVEHDKELAELRNYISNQLNMLTTSCSAKHNGVDNSISHVKESVQALRELVIERTTRLETILRIKIQNGALILDSAYDDDKKDTR